MKGQLLQGHLFQGPETEVPVLRPLEGSILPCELA